MSTAKPTAAKSSSATQAGPSRQAGGAGATLGFHTGLYVGGERAQADRTTSTRAQPVRVQMESGEDVVVMAWTVCKDTGKERVESVTDVMRRAMVLAHQQEAVEAIARQSSANVLVYALADARDRRAHGPLQLKVLGGGVGPVLGAGHNRSLGIGVAAFPSKIDALSTAIQCTTQRRYPGHLNSLFLGNETDDWLGFCSASPLSRSILSGLDQHRADVQALSAHGASAAKNEGSREPMSGAAETTGQGLLDELGRLFVTSFKAPPHLADKARALREELEQLGLVQTTTLRLRDPELGDRRVHVEFYPDLEREGSVLLRLTPASSTAPGTSSARAEDETVVGAELLSTTEAAKLLKVSRPYVVKLVDQGAFAGVQTTAGGHRRIPLAAVTAVLDKMRKTRKRAVDKVNELAAPLMQRELDEVKEEARQTGRVFVKRRTS